MPKGHGEQWFDANKDLVLEVFLAETHCNLRVLRQCLHDCGRVIDVLEKDLRKSTEAMKRFVRTYLVLSMALATGEITPKDLSDRSNHRCVVKPDKDDDPHPLYECSKRHQHAEIFAGNAASILPVELGFSLIGIGYEEQDKINKVLRETKQFSGVHDIPLWRRFVGWRKMSSKELDETYKEACSYIFVNEEIEPGPYLHLAHDVLSIKKDGGGDEVKTAEKIADRIDTLAEKNKIPAAAYGKGYGWSAGTMGFSFGGYSFEPNERTRPLIDAMRNAQNAAFDGTRINEAQRLLALFRSNLELFGREFSLFSDGNGYCETEILYKIDANEFANAIFDHVTSGNFEDVGTLLKTLADRHRQNRMPKELTWANKVKAILNSLANQAGELEKARMVWFLGFYWKFPVQDGGGT